MKTPDLKIGQQVWVQGRPHPHLHGHYDCYGEIIELDHDWEGDIESVTVWFKDSNTRLEVPSQDVYAWNEKNNSWSIFLEDFT